MAESTASVNNKNVEERIVAAKFDASDFEKGVNKTIKKLDELDEKLNFKKTGESIADLSKKASEAQDKAAKSMEKLTDRYTNFIGMMKQKVLSGLADQIVGVFFRLEKAALSFAKSMTFDPISAGFQKYQDALTSVRMIVNSYKTVKNEITGVNEKIHYTQEEASVAIDKLQTYADETSYSMSQMTDAMSKMVAAGVGLDQAQKNVQGIANACAAAGVNAQDAARAFFNLSQAYSSGKLMYTDYRSLELLNMTNENFQNQLLAAGVKAGTLKEKKDSKGNVTYVTQKSKTNGKVTAGKKITRKGLTESLKYGWATNEVMDYLFGNEYFVDIEDFRAAQKFTEGVTGPEKTRLRKEYLASLKDLDAIEKYITGLKDDNERKKTFKELTNDEDKKAYLTRLSKDADEINKISKKYGEIDDEAIKKYLGGLEEDDTRRQKYKELKTDKERKEYIKSLKEDADVIAHVKGKDLGFDMDALDKYMEGLKEREDYEENYRDQVEKYNAMTDAQKKNYLKQLAQESETLGKIGKKYDDVAIQAMLAAREARNLSDVINAIGDYVSSRWNKVFENLLGKLEDASDFFTNLSEGGIASIFTDLADWAMDVSDAFSHGGIGGQTLREAILSLDDALGNLFGMFNDIMPESSEFGETLYYIAGELSKALQSFDEWTYKVRKWLNDEENDGRRLKALQEVFANLSGVFSIIAKVAGVAFHAIDKGLTTLSPLLDAVVLALDAITAPIGELGKFENTKPFQALTDAVDNFFIVLQPLTGEDGQKVISTIGTILGVIGEFFVSGFIDTIVLNIQLVSDAIGFLIELFTKEKGSAQAKRGEGVIEGIRKEIESLGNACKETLGFVTGFFNNLFKDLRTLFGLEQKEGDTAIEDGGLFANIQNFLDTNQFLNQAQEWLVKAKEDILAWFATAVSNIQTWFANLPQTINDTIHNIFFKKIGTEKTDDASEESAEDTTNTLYGWLSNVKTNLTTWFDKAKTDLTKWFSELPGKISDFFTGFFYQKAGWYTDHDTGEKRDFLVETPLKKWLDGAVETVSTFITSLPEKLLGLLGKGFDFIGTIIDTIFGVSKENESDKNNDPNATKTAENVFLTWAQVFIEKAKTVIKGIPETVKTFFTETKTKFTKSIETIKTWFQESETGKRIAEWGKVVLDGIKDFIIKIPDHIKNIIKSIGSIGRSIISSFKEIFAGQDVGKEIQKDMEEQVNHISITGILNTIADIGTTIINQIISWFTGNDDIEYNFEWFITNISNFIKSIPGRIWDAVKDIGEGLSNAWGYFIRQFSNETPSEKSIAGVEADEAFKKAHPSLAKLIDGSVEWIKSIPEKFKTTWNDVVKELSNFWSNVTSYWDRLERIDEIQKKLNDPKTHDFEKQDLAKELSGLYEENDKYESDNPFISGAVKLLNKAVDWIKTVPSQLSVAWSDAFSNVSEFFSGIGVYWNKLGEFRSEMEQANKYNNDDPKRKEHYDIANEIADTYLHPFEEKYPITSSLIQNLSSWFDNIPKALSEAWESAKKSVIEFFDEFVDFWNDPSLWTNNTEDNSNQEPTEFEKKHPLIAGWVIAARKWIESIPTTLEESWNTTVSNLQIFWDNLTSYWDRLERIDEIQKKLNDPKTHDFEKQDLAKELSGLYQENDKYESDNPLLASITREIHNIPKTIMKAIDGISEELDNTWNYLIRQFNVQSSEEQSVAEIEADEAFKKAHPGLANLIDGAVAWIMNIPDTISSSIDSIGQDLSSAWNYIISQFRGQTTEEENISNDEFKKAHPSLAKLIDGSVEWIKDIPERLKIAWNGAVQKLSNFWNDITGYWDRLDRIDEIQKKLNDPKTHDFEKQDLAKELSGLYEENDKYESDNPFISGAVRLLNKAVDWIKTVPSQLSVAWSDAFTNIKEIFKGTSEYWTRLNTIREYQKYLDQAIQNGDTESVDHWQKLLKDLMEPSDFQKKHPRISGLVENINGWISDIPRLVSEAFSSAKDSLTNFWNELVAAFNGNDLDQNEDETSMTIGEKIKKRIINFFVNLPTYITEGIKGGLSLINSAIEGITGLFTGANGEVIDANSVGEAVAKNYEVALSKVEDETKKTIDEATKETGEAVKEAGEKDTPAKAFLNGIMSIGQSLWNIITQTIPGFISSGFKWISTHWEGDGNTPGWKDSLINIFENITGLKAEDFTFNNIVTSITTAIHNLPKTIATAFEDLKKALGIKKPLEDWQKNILNATGIPDTAKHDMKKRWEKDGYDISNALKETNIWGDIKGIADEWGKTLGEIITMVANNVGPFLINAWNGTLDLFAKLFGTIGEWLAGGVKKDAEGNIKTGDLDKAVENNFGKSISNELSTALTNIGENIYKLFTEKIPSFLGSAIGTIIDSIPTIVTNFMTALRSALGNNISEQTPGTIDAVTGDAKETIDEEVENLEKTLTEDEIRQKKVSEVIRKLLSNRELWQRYRQSGLEGVAKGFFTTDEQWVRYAEFERFMKEHEDVLDDPLIKLLINPDKGGHYYNRLSDPAKFKNDPNNMFAVDKDIIKQYEELLELTADVADDSLTKRTVDAATYGLNAMGTVMETLFTTFLDVDPNGNVQGISTMGWITMASLLIPKVIELIGAVKDIPHWSTSASTEAKNSINAVMKLALAALIAGAVFATIASQMNETQFSQAMTAMDKITGIITTIATISGVASAISSLSDVVGVLGESGGSIFGTLSIVAIAEEIKSLLHEIGSIIESIGIGIGGFAAAIKNSLGDIAEVNENLTLVSGIFTVLGTVMKDANAFIAEYKLHTEDPMGTITTALNNLFSPMINFAEVSKGSPAKDIMSAITELMGMTDSIETFVGWTENGIFDRFKYAISSLGSALSFYALGSTANVNDITDSGISNAIKFLKAIVGDDEFIGLAQKLSPDLFGGNVGDIQEATERLVVFAGALAKLGVASADIDEKTGPNIQEFLTVMSSLTIDDTTLITDENGNKIFKFAAAMTSLGSGIGALISSSDKITSEPESFDSIYRILSFLVQIANDIKGFEASGLGKLLIGSGDLNTFAFSIESIGQHLQKFMEYMHPIATDKGGTGLDWDLSALSKAMYALTQVSKAAQGLHEIDVNNLKSLLSDNGAIGENLLDFFVRLMGVTITYESGIKGLKMPKFTYQELRFDLILNLLDSFSQFSTALSKLEKIDVRKIIAFVNGYTWDDAFGLKELSDGKGGLLTLSTVADSIYKAFKLMSDKMSKNELNMDLVNQFIDTYRLLMEAIGSAYSLLAIKDPDTMMKVSTEDMMMNIVRAATILKDHTEDIFSVIDSIAKYDNEENLTRAEKVFNLIKLIGQVLSLFGGSIRTAWTDYMDFGKLDHQTFEFSGIGESISELQTLAQNSELLISVIDAIFNTINSALDTTHAVESANNIGSKVATLLINGIQSAFDTKNDEELPHIRVVLDDASVRDQMASLFGIDATQEFNISSGFAEAVKQAFGGSETMTSINTAVLEMNTKLDHLSEINQKVENLQGEMTQVQNSIASMNVYLDTGKLVGEIEPYITAQQDENINRYMNRAATGRYGMLLMEQ